MTSPTIISDTDRPTTLARLMPDGKLAIDQRGGGIYLSPAEVSRLLAFVAECGSGDTRTATTPAKAHARMVRWDKADNTVEQLDKACPFPHADRRVLAHHRSSKRVQGTS